VDGSGPPLLLVHSVNAAATVAEVKPVFDHYKTTRTVRALALVSPTGFSGGKSRRGPAGSTYAMPWLHRVLTGPGWGRAAFQLLTRPAVVRYFLNKTWGSKAIDETLWAYRVLTAQQAGAEHAPLCFLSRQMFSADIQTVYEAVRQPVWVAHGVRGDFTDYRGLSIVQGKPNWRISVYQTGAIPYFEVPQEFFPAFDRFLSQFTPR
jgi:hypothetical protein